MCIKILTGVLTCLFSLRVNIADVYIKRCNCEWAVLQHSCECEGVADNGYLCNGPETTMVPPCSQVFIVGPDKKLKLSLLYPATTGRNFV